MENPTILRYAGAQREILISKSGKERKMHQEEFNNTDEIDRDEFGVTVQLTCYSELELFLKEITQIVDEDNF